MSCGVISQPLNVVINDRVIIEHLVSIVSWVPLIIKSWLRAMNTCRSLMSQFLFLEHDITAS